MDIASFRIDDITFVLDIRPGPDRGTSAGDEFVLVKTEDFVDFYRSLQQHKPQEVLEVGMFEGGSMVLFDKLYSPRRLVGVDIRPEIPALEDYRAERDHVRPFYRQSQADPSFGDLLAQQFPTGIDLVVDDASHLYDLTRETFTMAWPLVRPGGLYVIEDWGWSHQRPYQAETHPLFDKPALSNLIVELVLASATNLQIDSVKVEKGWVTIQKSARPQGTLDLDAIVGMRGRKLELF